MFSKIYTPSSIGLTPNAENRNLEIAKCAERSELGHLGSSRKVGRAKSILKLFWIEDYEWAHWANKSRSALEALAWHYRKQVSWAERISEIRGLTERVRILGRGTKRKFLNVHSEAYWW